MHVPSIKYLSDVQHTPVLEDPVEGAVSIILAYYKTDINISVSLSGLQFPSYDTLGRLHYSFPQRHRCSRFSASEFNTVQYGKATNQFWMKHTKPSKKNRTQIYSFVITINYIHGMFNINCCCEYTSLLFLHKTICATQT